MIAELLFMKYIKSVSGVYVATCLYQRLMQFVYTSV